MSASPEANWKPSEASGALANIPKTHSPDSPYCSVEGDGSAPFAAGQGAGQARKLELPAEPTLSTSVDHWKLPADITAAQVEPETVADVSVDVSRVAGGGWRHSVRWLRLWLRSDLGPAWSAAARH